MNATAEKTNGVIQVKDTLRGWLVEAGDLHAAIAAGEKVALVLDSTLGLWVAADYAYKGREIAEMAFGLLDGYIYSPSSKTRYGHTTRDKAALLAERLERISFRYRAAEQERLGV